jgi:hypothetical protein
MSKEAVLLAANLTDPEARFLVANYYTAQEMRKRCDMQLRHMGEKDTAVIDPPATLRYTADAFVVIEEDVKKSLLKFAEGRAVGRWCLAQDGIGPVISAGLLAHLDIKEAPSAGHFWSFAGLNPERKWEKGERRPWNADLRQICWHLGQCAKRISGKENAFYGQLYKARKEYVVDKNERGFNAERAKTFFTRSADVKKVLAEGKLPPNNLDSQACNYVAKIFLSHLHALMYWVQYKKVPEKPFAIAHLGHVHEIKIPHLDMFPGFEREYYG